MPEGPGPHPGVVVIHEAYGLNDNIRGIAGRFATEGYAALAVDLFTDRSRAVCMARMLASATRGRDPLTLEQVGVAFSLTRERIRQIEVKALSKLRHPSQAERFMSLALP